jgi:hypothetical protein
MSAGPHYEPDLLHGEDWEALVELCIIDAELDEIAEEFAHLNTELGQ